ncbi:mothers against decapentaplegic homolog 7 isoform X3 [Bactrocera neohumeralis]|uniref:mothers against decapentaplegic homolog 7 isoform X3 n=1 Tax=Bactrocera neohumeralis TaxID=98809 RepID=UPI0021664563|nr:mothers against decapentaplegic homolog 7 isoform X3 [Bactrocera neohumeralis]
MLFRKDKELWRYASKNLSRDFDGMNNHSQQPPPHQHQHLFQTDLQYQNLQQYQNSFCHTMITSNTLTSNIEYFGSFTEVSYEQKANDSESGCTCGNDCDAFTVVTNEEGQAQNQTHLRRSLDYLPRLSHCSLQSNLMNQLNPTISITNVTTAASNTNTGTFSATVNMLRNCCGVSGLPTDYPSINSISHQNEKPDIGQQAVDGKQLQKSQHTFRKFMKMLNRQQQGELLDSVRCRKEMSASHDTKCILLKRSLIYKEEPHVICCRLFLWPNLRDATELKRLPICTADRHSIYVCCNPLHWCRVLETDQNSWCQVAYWELNERVGNRCSVHKPFVNIYADGRGNNNDSQDFCLRDLTADKTTPPREDVECTRQKIGFGLILSQEPDGIWLYNRSMAPVFILSPTLNESLSCVYKVTPGDCLKAFDINRAQSLICSSQFPGAELGPVNTRSICISFVKGWGKHYKRQNIMKCPCWLEIFFTQR